MIWVRSRRAWRTARASADIDRADWPFHHDTTRVPAPGYAPFIVGLGAGVGALGLAFGPLLLLSGLIVLLVGARYWLEAAMRETDATAAQERPGGQRP
jgi:hypothetical protein